jgi:hypothetical protein
LLALNPRGGFVIGIKLMESQAVAALMTSMQRSLKKRTLNCAIRMTSVIDELVLLVENLMKNNKIPKKRLFRGGHWPGGCDRFGERHLEKSPFFGWKDVHFATSWMCG